MSGNEHHVLESVLSPDPQVPSPGRASHLRCRGAGHPQREGVPIHQELRWGVDPHQLLRRQGVLLHGRTASQVLGWELTTIISARHDKIIIGSRSKV